MDLTKMRYFVAVGERLSFTAAADELRLSQSTVSRHVMAFEEEVGRQLFDRNKRTVKLTAAGALMLREAQAILTLAEEALRKVRDLERCLVGKLRLGLLGIPEQKIIPTLTRQFHLSQPGVDLEVRRLTWRQMNAHLQKRRIDVGFTLSMGLEHFPELRWESLGKESFTVVLPQDHPLAQEASIGFERLAGESFVLPSRTEAPAGSEWFLGLCAKAGFTPRIVAEPELIETVLTMVEAGMGISVVSGHLRQAPFPSLRFVPISDTPALTELVIAWHRDNPNPTVPLFIKSVKAYKLDHPSAR